MMSDSHFHKKDPSYKFNSPKWFILFRENPYNTYYEDLTIDLLKRSTTQEFFGMNYWDLMKLDIATFTKIRNAILDIQKELNKQREPMLKSLENNQPKPKE